MQEGNNPVFSGEAPVSDPVFPAGSDYIYPPEKKSKKPLMIVIVVVLLLGLGAAAYFLLVGSPGGTKIGEANNSGPGEILLLTSNDEGVRSYYRIGTDGTMFKVSKLDLDLTSDEGLSFIPLSCARVVFFARSQDMELCNSDSANPDDFGSDFFSLLRFPISDVIDAADLDRRVVFRQVFKSYNRTFVSIIFVTEDNGRRSILLEYRDDSLSEVTAFNGEQIQWVQVREEPQ